MFSICFGILVYTYSNNVSSCQELLIHWANDLFYYTGLHLLLINKLNHHNSVEYLINNIGFGKSKYIYFCQ